MKHRILVLRPYGPDIRRRMFDTLGLLGIHPAEEDILSADLTDDEVLSQIENERAGILLCPFNNLKMRTGELTNGLRLLQKIYRVLPHFAGVPVLMPVSLFSAAIFQGTLSRGTDLGPVPESLRNAILVIRESEFDHQETLSQRIAEHLAPLPPLARMSSSIAIA